MKRELPFNIWLEESAYIHIRINSKEMRQMEQQRYAQELIDSLVTICKGNSFPFLIDLRNSSGEIMVELGRKLSGNDLLEQLCLAEAFVVNSLGTRLLVNFYRRVYQSAHPSEIFTDIVPAREWMKEFSIIN